MFHFVINTSMNQYSNMRLISTGIQLWPQSELMQRCQLIRFRVLYLLWIFIVCFYWFSNRSCLHSNCRLIHLMKNLRSWSGWALKRYFKSCPECQLPCCTLYISHLSCHDGILFDHFLAST